MRATLNIPDKLLDEIKNITGEKSKTKAIVVAMEEFLKRKKLEKLLSLRGKVEIDYDWETAEEKELDLQEKREKHFEK